MFSSLPAEIVFEIASYLDENDYVSFSNADKRLLNLLASSKRVLNLPASYNVDFSSLKAFLHVGAKDITKLDLSNCYWFDAASLTELITGLPSSLKILHVQGTRLCSKHIAVILKKCPNICDLAISFLHGDPTFWKDGAPADNEAENLLGSCIFSELRNQLQKLHHLSLYGNLHAFKMFIIFLCFCGELRSVHFELQATDCVLELEDITEVRPIFFKVASMLPPWSFLERVTSRIFNGNFMSNFFMASYIKEAFLNRISSSLPNGREGLQVLWIPHGGMSSPVPLLKRDCTALLTAETSSSVMEFNGLTSLCIKADARTASPRVLRDATWKLSNLRMISCAYNSKDFLDFARCHPDMRIVQFQSSCHHDLAGPELAEGLGLFKRLEKFSTDPRYFRDYVTHRGALPLLRFPSVANRAKEPLNLAVMEMAYNCPLLNEVEIGVFATLSPARYDREDHVCEITSLALSMLSRCANLARLTLANLDVDSMGFLSPILSRCSRLRSLRLTNIRTKSPDLVPMVVKELQLGLPVATQLEDFRWEVGKSKNEFKKPSEPSGATTSEESSLLSMDGSPLLEALKLCRTLRRFAIIADYTVPVHFTEPMIMNWPHLVLACFISPTVNWEECSLRIQSSHPAFQCYLGTSKAHAADQLVPLHYHEMILFDSAVARLPY